VDAQPRRAVCRGDSHIKPNLTTNLSAWAAMTFTKLPSKHISFAFRARYDIYLKLCFGDMGILLLLFLIFVFLYPFVVSYAALLLRANLEASITHVKSLQTKLRNQGKV